MDAGISYNSEQDWHKLRQGNVGASEVASLFVEEIKAEGDLPAYILSPYGLWQVKAGNAPAPMVDNERVKLGNFLEAGIADCLAEKHNWQIEKAAYYHDNIVKGMGCSPDYLITKAENKGTPALLEIKNVDYLVYRDKWKKSGEPPLHIMLQLQHQLACTGLNWGVIGTLVGGNETHIYEFKARPKIINEIRKRIAAFWASIEANTPPALDGMETTAGIIETQYSSVTDDIDLTGDNELPNLCAEYLKANESFKAQKEAVEQFKNALKAKAEGHSGILCQGFRINLVKSKDTPDRVALPGEIIKGRKGSTRLSVKEL